MTKICLISDCHSLHRKLAIPYGMDALICAGDITGRGELSVALNFNEWAGTLKIPRIILIPGNHDFCLQDAMTRSLMTNVEVLLDSQTKLGDLTVYGSPWTPKFGSWAFMRRAGEEMKRAWDGIPEGMDILVTHGPPRGIRSTTVRGSEAGCDELLKAIRRTKPRIHLHGHIHEQYGYEKRGSTLFVNASVVDVNYDLVNKPIVVKMTKKSCEVLDV